MLIITGSRKVLLRGLQQLQMLLVVLLGLLVLPRHVPEVPIVKQLVIQLRIKNALDPE